MPGLVGLVYPDNPSSTSTNRRSTIGAMQDLIQHFPFHQAGATYTRGGVSAGLVSLEDDESVATAQQGNCVVWLDGEFYNRSEIGGGSRYASDAAFLAGRWSEDAGKALLTEIDGMYAGVIYDAEAGKLHLVCDRYGMKHLYWMPYQDGIAWASELKAFLVLPEFDPQIDEQAVEAFVRQGYIGGADTWFDQVSLLDPAGLLTFDQSSERVEQTCYWDWNDIPPVPPNTDLLAGAHKLGELFQQAVERRVQDDYEGATVGVGLSGGLDSRAVVAAVPTTVSMKAVTFGRTGSRDVRIARQVADKRGIPHEVFQIDHQNWLDARFDAIWWTDAGSSLKHMHGTRACFSYRDSFGTMLNGFLGDVMMRGYYLNRAGDGSEFEQINNRGRRMIRTGPKKIEQFVRVRFPFMDKDLLDWVFGLPAAWRRDGLAYKEMLMSRYPEYFEHIPWAKTGVPLTAPTWRVKLVKGMQLMRQILVPRMLARTSWAGGYAHYEHWLRREPGRSVFAELLKNDSARYTKYLDREMVTKTLERHLAGEDHSEMLCRYATLEIWLQQVFEGRFRRTETAEKLSA